jgi:hypothetical protein
MDLLTALTMISNFTLMPARLRREHGRHFGQVQPTAARKFEVVSF